MKLKKLLQSISVGLVSAAIIVGSIGVSAVDPANGSTEPTTLFTKTVTADFTALPDGAVDDNDAATVKYLKDRFTFYAYQYRYPWAFGSGEYISYFFERPNVNGYVLKDRNGAWGTLRFPDTMGEINGMVDGTVKDFENSNIADGIGYISPDVPTWTVDNEWLYCTAYQGAESFPFRQCNIMYLRGDTPSTLANLKDFNLEMDFMFHPLTDGMLENDNLAIVFDGATAGAITQGNQLMFALAPNGNYYIGMCNYWSVPELTSSSGVPFERGVKYHLSMKNDGKTLDILITAEDGTELLALYEENLPTVLSGVGGKLGITGSNMGAKYANIQVTPLNDDYAFKVTANELIDYRLMDFSSWENRWNQIYLRGNESVGWSNKFYNGNDVRSENVDGSAYNRFELRGTERRENLANYLGTKFDVYQDSSFLESDGTRTQHYIKGEKFNSILSSGFYGSIDIAANGGMSAGLMAFVDTAPHGDRKLLDQTISLVPKKGNGQAVQTENFETEFTTYLENDANKAIALSFRSNTPGMMIGKDQQTGSADVSYADKVTLMLSGQGYALLDGTEIPVEAATFEPWTDKPDGVNANVDVKVKAVGQDLYIKVVNNGDGSVLLENTFTLVTPAQTGYLYYSACHQFGYFYSIKCNVLDDTGNPYYWNTNPPEYTISAGDANGDGFIDLLDVVCIKEYLVKARYDFDGDADIDADQKIDSLDLQGVRGTVLTNS